MKTHFLPMLIAPALAGSLCAALLDASVKGFALLIAAALLALALRKATAATRHLLWLMTMSAALGLPVLSLALPAWRVLPARMRLEEPVRVPVAAPVSMPLPMPRPFVRPEEGTAAEVAPAAAPIEAMPALPDPPALLPAKAPAPRISQVHRQLRPWYFIIAWAAGLVAMLARLVRAAWVLRRYARSSTICAPERLVEAARGIAGEIGLRRPFVLRIGHAATMPMAWGIFRPKVVLPACAEGWAGVRLRAVLLHELAHLRRHDALALLIANLARAAHWFDPLVWLALRQMRIEQERAADDYVLRAGLLPSDYADQLLEIATGLDLPLALGPGVLAMADSSRLEGRLRTILDPAQNRRRLTRWMIVASFLVAAAVVLPLAMLRAGEAGKGRKENVVDVTVHPAPPTPGEPPDEPALGVVTAGNQCTIETGMANGTLRFALPGARGIRGFRHTYSSVIATEKPPVVITFEDPGADGTWWEHLKLSRGAQIEALLPELPKDWMPKGRVVVRAQTARVAGGTEIVFADLVTTNGQSFPISVRSQEDASDHSEEQLPYTYVPVELKVSTKLVLLGAAAPKQATPVDQHQADALISAAKGDLVSGPGGVAVAGKMALEKLTRTWPGWHVPWDQVARITVETRQTPTKGGTDLHSRVTIALPPGRYETIREAADAALKNTPPADAGALQVMEGEYTGELAADKTLLLPIDPKGALPERLGVLITAEPVHVGRSVWGPLSQAFLDGWIATMPADWQDRLPRYFENSRHQRDGTGQRGLEVLGTFHEPEADGLLKMLEWSDGVSVKLLRGATIDVAHEATVGNEVALLKIRLEFISDRIGLGISPVEKSLDSYLADRQINPTSGRVKPGEYLALLLSESEPVTRSRLLLLRASLGDALPPAKIVLQRRAANSPPLEPPRGPAPGVVDEWVDHLLDKWSHEELRDLSAFYNARGQLVARMGMYEFQYPGTEATAAMNALRLRYKSEADDCTIADLFEMLTAIRAVDPAPIGWLEKERLSKTKATAPPPPMPEIWPPEKLKTLTFGPTASDGLRVACAFEPAGDSYALGEIIKCKLVFQNPGAETVEFRTSDWSLHCHFTVRSEQGKETEHVGDWQLLPRLRSGVIEFKPGEALAIDLPAAGVGRIGRIDYREEEARGTIGFGFSANAGDRVRAEWEAVLSGTDRFVELQEEVRKNAAARGMKIVNDPQPPAPNGWSGKMQTGEIAFDVIERSIVDAATGPGSYQLATEGTSLEKVPLLGDLFNAAHRPTLQIVRDPLPDHLRPDQAVIHWPADGSRPTVEYRIALPADGAKYVLAWLRGGSSLWIADESQLREVSFNDPARIVENTFGRQNNGGFGDLAPEVLAELEKVFPIGRKDGTVGGKSGGQRISSARTVEGWIVEGTVTDADGKPVAGVDVHAASEYQPLEVVAEAHTGPDGRYALQFQTDLETLSKFRGLSVQASMPGFREKNGNAAGQFTLALKEGKLVDHKADRKELVLGQSTKLDFTMLQDGR